VAERRIAVRLEVFLDLAPVPVVLPDLFARTTDGEQAVQGIDAGQGGLQILNGLFAFRLDTLASVQTA
jgi:hypothetical protein